MPLKARQNLSVYLGPFYVPTPDKARAAGRPLGPLHGVPIGIKDLLWTHDMPTAGGMKLHRQFRPSEDATAVARLRQAGAVILGKLQNTEGACLEHHPEIPVVRNPWHPALWAGISSSGLGAALAAGSCYGALGTDTGGSIRWPAAQTGVTGIKPTWGRVSRHGLFALAESMDHVGPMARSVEDAAMLLQAIAGPDPADPTAAQAFVPDYLANGGVDLAGVRIGIDRAWTEDDVDAAPRATLRAAEAVLRAAGARIIDVRVPAYDAADWHPLRAIEVAVAHRATFPSRRDAYGPRLASVIDYGRTLSGMHYQDLLLRRATLRGAYAALFTTIDLLLTPAHPYAPLTQAAVEAMNAAPAPMEKLQRYTARFDMTGAPTLSFPGQLSPDGFPVGIQLVARPFEEHLLIRAGIVFQRETDWHRHRPRIAAHAAGNTARR